MFQAGAYPLAKRLANFAYKVPHTHPITLYEPLPAPLTCA